MIDEHRSALIYHPGFLGYDFGPQHPLRPERISAGLDLLETAGLLDRERDTLAPRPSTEEELELIHAPAFIRAVQEAGSGWFPAVELRRYGMGPGDTPAFPGVHDASALIAGGGSSAARAVMSGQVAHAFHPAGGLHHAHRDRASGFCVYNDPALAAAVAAREYGARVAYLDFDCHHGDGVQWLFYDDPNIMTISFHETGRFLFPGTGGVDEVGEGEGRGFSLNVPVAPFTQDESWIESIRAVVPAATRRFQPDLVISSHGADTHVWDPLTHLALTTASFVPQAELVHFLAHEYAAGRWIAVGSGGYDWRRVVPRSWAIVWAEMTGRTLPTELPKLWRERWDTDPSEPLPATLLDTPTVSPPVPRVGEIERCNRETVDALRGLIGLTTTVQ